MNNTTQTLSRKQLAATLGVAVITVDRLIAAKAIGYYKFGRRVVFGQHHVDEYRRKCEIKPA